VVEPGSKAISFFFLDPGQCFIQYQAGTLESNQSASDKLSVGGATLTECEVAGYAITGGKLKSVTGTAAGATNLVFSPALKVKTPGPCYYSYTKMSGPYEAGSLFANGSATGTLIKAGSIPGCAPEKTDTFTTRNGYEFEENFYTDLTTETQLSSYKAEAKVVLEGGGCGIYNGHPYIGTAKFTRNSSKSAVTVTYKVKGALPSTSFAVILLNATGIGPTDCEFLGYAVNKTTNTTSFTTNAKGEGSFTGGLTVPRNDTELLVASIAEGETSQINESLRVSLP